MTYVLIFTHDHGAHWQPTGVALADSDAVLREMRAVMAANPDLTVEMHVLHPHLYAALTQPAPVPDPFF